MVQAERCKVSSGAVQGRARNQGRGERYGWDEVVRRFGGPLRRRVQSMLWRLGIVPGSDQVEDLMQEFYCRLLAGGAKRLEECRERSDAETFSYLARIAEHVAIDVLRAGQAAKRSPGRGMEVAWEAQHVERATTVAASPEERLLGSERLRLFLEHCGTLGGPQDERRNTRILGLALVGGFSSVEISRGLGGRLAPSSIDSMMHRIKRRLAAQGIHLPDRGSARLPRRVGTAAAVAGVARRI